MENDVNGQSQLIAFNITDDQYDLRNCFTNFNNLIFLKDDPEIETDESLWIRFGIQIKTVPFINEYKGLNLHLRKMFGKSLLRWLPGLKWCSTDSG